MREFPPGDVFLARAARELGWTQSALDNAVRQGRVRRPRRGVYALAGADERLTRIRAVALAYPQAVISHRSAVGRHGLPLVCPPPELVDVTVAPRSNANLVGVNVHRAGLRPQDVCLIDGVVVTSVARTVCDVARHHPTPVGVALIDAALQQQSATAAQIDDVLRSCRGWPGAARAMRAWSLSDGRSESPLESLSRLAFPDLDLPLPQPQVWILDRHGQRIGRADFYWDEFGVVGEADGQVKYADASARMAEKERQEAFEDLGLVVARWQWKHATRLRGVLRTKIVTAFERGQRRDATGFPRLWTPQPTDPRV